MKFIEITKHQIKTFQEQLRNNIYILEDKSVQEDTKKYSEILYNTGILKGRIEGLEQAISLYEKNL